MYVQPNRSVNEPAKHKDTAERTIAGPHGPPCGTAAFVSIKSQWFIEGTYSCVFFCSPGLLHRLKDQPTVLMLKTRARSTERGYDKDRQLKATN
mmetsp:Transcript_25242/g.73041  ORF Transcript_25242/g.73041 Transcript_25242/m.73041 type:complete len:94 (-) Transcript_25242:2238-2519(-)